MQKYIFVFYVENQNYVCYNWIEETSEFEVTTIKTIKKQQLEFLDWKMGVFFHFGIRTFYEGHKDWDLKEMPLSGFNPSELDCEQWIRTVKEAGATYAILVCKHHDGFANWQSEYTD